MSKEPITLTSEREEQVKEAINDLKSSQAHSQQIGLPGNEMRIWVTKKESPLGEQISQGDERYKKYLLYKDNGELYYIFTYLKGSNYRESD